MTKYHQAEIRSEDTCQPTRLPAYENGLGTQGFGTVIALTFGVLEKEFKMFNVIQIFAGFVIGCIGFMQIAENPIQGCSALLLSGFIILAGLDRSRNANR